MDSLVIVATFMFIFCPVPETIDGMGMQDTSFPRESRFPNSRSRSNRNPLSAFMGQHRAGAKDHAVVNGEYVETTRVLVQRMTPMGVGYYAYGKPKTPVFIRIDNKEMNRKFIIFQDPYLPPGEGYLVVLKKIPLKANFLMQRMMNQGVQPQMPMAPENFYDSFHLHLSNNIHGNFDRLNVRKFAYGIRTRFTSRIKARRKWLRRRQMRTRNRRRFGVSRWRGKRSTDQVRIDKRRKKVGHCVFSRLNITEVRLKAEKLALQMQSLNYTPPAFIDEIEIYDDFEY